MKIELPFFDENQVRVILQKAGYSVNLNPENKKLTFIRRLSQDWYPRFHAYLIFEKNKRLFLNLHLDQKQASYSGFLAHAAEYNGELVEKEIKRIKNFLDQELEKKKILKKTKEEGFLKRIFKF